MANKIFYQEDCNLSLLDGKKIANLGKEPRSRALRYIQQQRLPNRQISS